MQSYTTIDQVRQSSGLRNASRIPPDLIYQKITESDQLVRSAIAQKYILPIAYHRQVELTFGGTVSGSGTLNIVVNGTTYPITITGSTTSAQAALAFASVTSTDFYTKYDSVGSKVTIVSKQDSAVLAVADAQVTVTPPSTTAGISVTVGQRLNRYPPIVSQLSADIAAVLLLDDNYGIEAENTTEDQDRRWSKVNSLLGRINGTEEDAPPLLLTDEFTEVELALRETGGPHGYPNDQSNADPLQDTGPYVSMNATF